MDFSGGNLLSSEWKSSTVGALACQSTYVDLRSHQKYAANFPSLVLRIQKDMVHNVLMQILI